MSYKSYVSVGLRTTRRDLVPALSICGKNSRWETTCSICGFVLYIHTYVHMYIHMYFNAIAYQKSSAAVRPRPNRWETLKMGKRGEQTLRATVTASPLPKQVLRIVL